MCFVISLTYLLEKLIHLNVNFVICYVPWSHLTNIRVFEKTLCASNFHREKPSITSKLHTKPSTPRAFLPPVHTGTTFATIKQTKYTTSIQAKLPRCFSCYLETTYYTCGYEEATKIYSSLNIKTNATGILQMKNCPEYKGYSQTHSGRCQNVFWQKA